MWFWWFVLICDLIIPLAMILGGILMWKHCPKKINGFFGYRTSLSMRNMDTWKFAHGYCGKLWWIIGMITLPLSVAIHIPFYHSDEDLLGTVSIVVMIVQCVILICSILPTERALKKTFNSDGTRK